MTDAAISTIADWLARRLTPICWLVGPSGCGKTIAANAILRSTEPARLLPLSAASPDRCLRQLFNQRTTAGLFATLTAEATRLLVLDALDTVQYRVDEENGRVFDARLRHLLSAAARGTWPALSTLVTSRFRPPPDLPNDRVRIVELGPAQPPIYNSSWLSKGAATAILEALASSRKASSGWLLGLLSGQSESHASLATPATVRVILDRALGDGLVQRVDLGRSGEWVQMPDEGHRRFLPSHHAVEVHRSIAGALESDELSPYVELAAGTDPELRHDLEERAIVHRLEAGDMGRADESRADLEAIPRTSGSAASQVFRISAPPGEVR